MIVSFVNESSIKRTNLNFLIFEFRMEKKNIFYWKYQRKCSLNAFDDVLMCQLQLNFIELCSFHLRTPLKQFLMTQHEKFQIHFNNYQLFFLDYLTAVKNAAASVKL